VALLRHGYAEASVSKTRTVKSPIGELKEALRALAPIPERRVASSAFCLREVGIEDRTLLVPLHPLGARHLTNH
jgi:hypothetical protein